MAGFLAALARVASRAGVAAQSAKSGAGGLWSSARKTVAQKSKGGSSGLFGFGGRGRKRPGVSKPSQPKLIAFNEQAPQLEKPKIDFGKLMGQMGNPNALADARAQAAKQEAAQQANQPQQRGWNNVPEQFQQAGEEAEGLGKKFLQMLGSVTGVSDKMDGLKALLAGDVVTAAKKLAVGTLKAATLLVTLPIALKKFSESVLESREKLRTYNTSIGAAFSRLDMQRMRLDWRQANATSGTASGLANQVADLRENTQAIRELAGNVTNLIGIGAAIVAKVGLMPLNQMSKQLNDILVELGLRREGDPKPINRQFIDDIAGGANLLPKDRLPNPPRLGAGWRP